MRERVLRKTLILHPLPRKNKNSLPAVSVDLPDCNGSGSPAPAARAAGARIASGSAERAGRNLPSSARGWCAPARSTPLFFRGSQGAGPLPGWLVDEEGSAQDCTRSAAQGSPVTLL